MPNAILDPTGGSTVSEQPFSLAPRTEDLAGATVGLLDNGKQNADAFLEEVGRLLRRDYGVASTTVLRKRVGTAESPREELEQLRGCDIVVTGVGDCGSCSASAVADGIALERLGIPAAVVCSDAFSASADEIAKIHGAAGYAYVAVPHPMAGLTHDQVAAKAAAAAASIASLVVRSSARSTQRVA